MPRVNVARLYGLLISFSQEELGDLKEPIVSLQQLIPAGEGLLVLEKLQVGLGGPCTSPPHGSEAEDPAEDPRCTRAIGHGPATCRQTRLPAEHHWRPSIRTRGGHWMLSSSQSLWKGGEGSPGAPSCPTGCQPLSTHLTGAILAALTQHFG